MDRKKAYEQSVRDLDRQEALRDKEREMWEEKFHAELKMTEKKIELDRTAKASLAKLPQLEITPFRGTTCFLRKLTADQFLTKKSLAISLSLSGRKRETE